mmetsp:Transcript_29839/g.72768  ORF Transcript_29839/g.72768 Transcript_29839/m.72768 type:complete len:133 (-) Transcript_29839:1684-2082(-)
MAVASQGVGDEEDVEAPNGLTETGIQLGVQLPRAKGAEAEDHGVATDAVAIVEAETEVEVVLAQMILQEDRCKPGKFNVQHQMVIWILQIVRMLLLHQHLPPHPSPLLSPNLHLHQQTSRLCLLCAVTPSRE